VDEGHSPGSTLNATTLKEVSELKPWRWKLCLLHSRTVVHRKGEHMSVSAHLGTGQDLELILYHGRVMRNVHAS
jgi:hypothetical protein